MPRAERLEPLGPSASFKESMESHLRTSDFQSEASSGDLLLHAARVLEPLRERAFDEPAANKTELEHVAVLLRSELAQLAARGIDRTARAAELWFNLAFAEALLARDAEPAFSAALEREPTCGAWWFQLGLYRKHTCRFAEADVAFVAAQRLLGDTRAVLFNRAICATALGYGSQALELWRQLGIAARLNRAGFAVVDGIPGAMIRTISSPTGYATTAARASSELDASLAFEVLAVTPLSPCHGVVSSPAFRDAACDYGDVVLWDAAPVAVSTAGVPVFSVLAVLHRGDERRFRFVALEQSQGAVVALQQALGDRAMVFVGHQRVENVCSRCASGEHLVRHEHLPPSEHRLVYGKLIVPSEASLVELRKQLEAAQRDPGHVAMAIPGLYEALGDTAAASKAHKAWAALERTGLKKN